MDNNPFAVAAIALAVFFGLLVAGQSIKYGFVRHACITSSLSVEQCFNWNHSWQRQ